MLPSVVSTGIPVCWVRKSEVIGADILPLASELLEEYFVNKNSLLRRFPRRIVMASHRSQTALPCHGDVRQNDRRVSP